MKLKFPKLVRHIEEGEILPRWWGVLRRDYVSDRTIIAPIVLNVILRIADSIYIQLAEYPLTSYELGFRDGFNKAMRVVRRYE